MLLPSWSNNLLKATTVAVAKLKGPQQGVE
jgi:hypothetical protein